MVVAAAGVDWCAEDEKEARKTSEGDATEDTAARVCEGVAAAAAGVDIVEADVAVEALLPVARRHRTSGRAAGAYLDIVLYLAGDRPSWVYEQQRQNAKCKK